MKPLILFMVVASLSNAHAIPAHQQFGKRRDGKNAAAENLREALPLVREGDIVFIRVKSFLYRKVAETSRSWESHVGIIFRNPDGAWMVAESTIPVSKFTPLEKFVARSEDGRFSILRLRADLSREEVLRLRAAAESRMGIFYHLGFKYDSPRLFCSKLVYDSYLESTGRSVGHLETFRELLTANPDAPLWFWRIWFFGRIPWERRCVTTTSQLQSGSLVTVFDSETHTRHGG